MKNFDSIDAALESMVKGEVVDYRCDSCNEEVDLKRQTLISSTPNILIIHLQRYHQVFLDNNTRAALQKINDYYEFPAKLDLEKYSYHKVMEEEGIRIKTPQEI